MASTTIKYQRIYVNGIEIPCSVCGVSVVGDDSKTNIKKYTAPDFCVSITFVWERNGRVYHGFEK